MRKKKFIIVDQNIGDLNEKNLEPGIRILEVLFSNIKLAKSEEFESINQLKKRSKIFKTHLKENPQRAIKIIKPHFIIKQVESILTPSDTEFDEVSFLMLQHSFQGIIKRENVQGIHLLNILNKRLVRIKDIVEPANKYGVYKAKVEKYDKEKKLWIEKKSYSTFFPDNWTLSQFMCECYSAFRTRIRIDEKKFRAVTLSGIPVEIIISSKGEFKTIYPLMN